MPEQLFQIGVKALVRNQKGEILMVHVPEWGDNPAHWDLPGGRMDPCETFLQTLQRELTEELGVTYIGEPKQLMGMLTNITIPVGDKRFPLVFMIYDVKVADVSQIRLADDTREDKIDWFVPVRAADVMAVKFAPEFCDLVRNL